MSQVIFVTGASSFLGCEIVAQLLEQGYHVRGTARGSKIKLLEDGFTKFRDIFQVVPITDICQDQVSEALHGVDGLIHVASPHPGRYDSETTFRTAVEGALNIMQQAEKAGVTNIVITSSIGAVRNANGTWNNDDWNTTTKEQAFETNDDIAIYAAAKTYAEKAVWNWAALHPHVEVTTLCPSIILGPLANPFFCIPSPDFDALATNLRIFNLIVPYGVFHWNNFLVDIRDVAKAHVLALKSPSTSLVGRKRLVFSSPHGVSWGEAVQYLVKYRPELRDRLITTSPPSYTPDRMPVDFARIEEVLGMKKEDFHTFQQTVVDAVDSLLRLENLWKNNGHLVEIPLFNKRPVNN